MKTFTDWATENNLKVPTVNENAKRGGIATWAYPDAYARGQYPSNYFMEYLESRDKILLKT